MKALPGARSPELFAFPGSGRPQKLGCGAAPSIASYDQFRGRLHFLAMLKEIWQNCFVLGTDIKQLNYQ